MTDLEALYRYRINQAEESLEEAKELLKASLSTRSIVNRSYYTVFYATLALLLKENVTIKTSKHIGIISLLDKELVHKNIFNKEYSVIAHELFKARQESDYEEFVEISTAEAKEHIKSASDFLNEVKKYLKTK